MKRKDYAQSEQSPCLEHTDEIWISITDHEARLVRWAATAAGPHDFLTTDLPPNPRAYINWLVGRLQIGRVRLIEGSIDSYARDCTDECYNERRPRKWVI